MMLPEHSQGIVGERLARENDSRPAPAPPFPIRFPSAAALPEAPAQVVGFLPRDISEAQATAPMSHR